MSVCTVIVNHAIAVEIFNSTTPHQPHDDATGRLIGIFSVSKMSSLSTQLAVIEIFQFEVLKQDFHPLAPEQGVTETFRPPTLRHYGNKK